MLGNIESCIACFNIVFTPEGDVLLPRFTGKIVLSCFLNIISVVDEGLAVRLHEDRGVKPYSCTPFSPYGGECFLVPRGRVTLLRGGRRYWFRVTLLDAGLVHLFLNSVALLQGLSFTLMDRRCVIESVNVQLMDHGSLGLGFESDLVKVRFLTPTRFSVRGTGRRKGPKFRLFPVPENLFHSLVHHWNSFTHPDYHIPESKFLDYVVDYVVEDDYKITRESVELGGGQKAVGFTGYCAYKFNNTKSPFYKAALKLLAYGQLVNVGTGKSMGLGVIKVEPFIKKEKRNK